LSYAQACTKILKLAILLDMHLNTTIAPINQSIDQSINQSRTAIAWTEQPLSAVYQSILAHPPLPQSSLDGGDFPSLEAKLKV